MKKLASAAAIGGLLCATSIHASDGTITFTGSVTANTCTIKINGGAADATITLPTVSASQLAKGGDTAGSTPINFALSACQTGTSAATGAVKAYFETGTNVDPATGRLKNTAASGATNVQLQLLNSDDSVITIGDASTIKGGTLAAGTGPGSTASSATFAYAVRYYNSASGSTAAGSGSVSSSVTYSVTYQ